jgi:hypothetical protein
MEPELATPPITAIPFDPPLPGKEGFGVMPGLLWAFRTAEIWNAKP